MKMPDLKMWIDNRISDERVRAINSETTHGALMAQARETTLREVADKLKLIEQ